MDHPETKKPHDEEAVHVREHGPSSLDSDSTHLDEIDQDCLPDGYFRSKFFLGSMTAIGLGLLAGVCGFAYAAPILTVINADIGPVRSLPLLLPSLTSLTPRQRTQTSSGQPSSTPSPRPSA